MLPVFVYPLAFIGLASLPVLAAIYILRNRHRRHVVSSLMLWMDPRQAREGGTRIRRFQTPLLFFLELLVLLLLVLAAAGPYVHSSESARPLVIVLDDSFSMLAGGDDSTRNRAVKAIEEELDARGRPSVRFVLAGERPALLGESARSRKEIMGILEQWRCQSPTANLEEALALAAEVGGEAALLLVVTDRAPEAEPEEGRVQWWAFGEARPNLAFVTAARNYRDGVQRCLLEVANLSGETKETTLIVEAGEAVERSAIRLEKGQTHRVILQLGEGTPALRARIDGDALGIDNEVHLVPAVVKPVRVDVKVFDGPLRELCEKAVHAVRGAALSADDPHLVITDKPGELEAPDDAWVLQIIADKEAEAYVGPFVIDHAHPLTEGLSLQGVVWSAGKSAEAAGAPVVMAGNVPLLTDSESAAGRHTLRMRFRHDLSTLQDSPNWPILMANLIQWRASALPGLSRPNVRLGEEAMLTLTAVPEEGLQLRPPGGEERPLPVRQRRAVVRAGAPGVYEVRAGGERFSFAVNALSREESNLSDCGSGRWGSWLDETALRTEYRDVAWALLLGVLALAALHSFLVAREGGRRAR